MGFPKRLYPHLHEIHRLCGGDYNNSIVAQHYHHVYEREVEFELQRHEKEIETRYKMCFGDNGKIHKINEDGKNN